MKNTHRYLKDIFIGKYIQDRIKELNIPETRIAKFIGCDEKLLQEYYNSKSVEADVLLRFSKILEYDFFRLYSQHLIFYAPPSSVLDQEQVQHSSLPKFRKNIYTREMIDFVLGLIRNNEKSIKDVIEDYRIPKTTLYRWLRKH